MAANDTTQTRTCAHGYGLAYVRCVPSADRQTARHPAAGSPLLMEERIAKAITLAEMATDDAIGEALVRTFPEATSGDERPDTAFALMQTIGDTVRAWVEDNVTGPAEDAAEAAEDERKERADAADLRAMRTDPAYWDKRDAEYKRGRDAARTAITSGAVLPMSVDGSDGYQKGYQDAVTDDRRERAACARGCTLGRTVQGGDHLHDTETVAEYDARTSLRPAPVVVPVRIGSSGQQAKCGECGLPVSEIVATPANSMTSRRFCDGPNAYPDHVPAPCFYPGRVTVRDLQKLLQAEPNKDVPILLAAPDGWYSYVGEYHVGPRDGMDENDGYTLPTIGVGESYDPRDL